MKTKTSAFFLLALIMTATVFVSACGFFVDSRTTVSPSKPVVYEKSKLNYGYIKQNLLLKRCEGCHKTGDTAGGVNLDSYELVVRNLRGILRTAVVLRSMPQREPLNDAEAALLEAWINAGAPRGDDPPPAQPDPSPTPSGPVAGDFTYIKNVLFVKHACYECHTPGRQGQQVPLDDLESLKDPEYSVVVPGNPEESRLVFTLETLGRNRMPPVTSGAGMTPDEIKIIRDWISRGALATE